MLDWKILAASFAALLVISSVLVGGFGIGDFLTSITDKMGELLGGSPFSGFFAARSAAQTNVDITLFPKNLTLKPDSAVNISTEDIQFNGFDGEIILSLEANEIILLQKGSTFSVKMPAEKTEIKNMGLSEMKAEGMKFNVENSINTENGTVELSGFVGSALIEADRLELHGNVSSIKVKLGEMEFKSP